MVRTFVKGPYTGRSRKLIKIEDIEDMKSSTSVVASITELTAVGGSLDYPHLGEAPLEVLNVAPYDDGSLYIRAYVDYDYTLPFRLTLFVDPQVTVVVEAEKSRPTHDKVQAYDEVTVEEKKQ